MPDPTVEDRFTALLAEHRLRLRRVTLTYGVGTSSLRRIVDHLAGRRLVAARDFQARLDGFERGA